MSNLLYELPLTSVASKVRVKERITFSDYGLPIAPTKTLINEKHYIEWQIGYDKVVDKENFHFLGANQKHKKLYELSEIVLKFYKLGVIKQSDLEKIKYFIENNSELIEDKMQINRSVFKPTNIAKTPFLESFISYPLLVYKFKDNDFLSEIVIKEKQRAVGIQAMLYFCFPLHILKDENNKRNFLGRMIESKEKGYLEINENNIFIFLKMFEIFGILSQNHKHDILQILDYILKS